MEHKGNKIWTKKMSRTLLWSLGAAALVTSTVNALTLDTSIFREIPYLQRLLITTDGDATSSSYVEISGSSSNLIKLSNFLGTNDVLQAPVGVFTHTARVSGDSFALGTLTTDLFSFDIISYYTSYLGGGGISDGSCPTDQAVVGFSGGVAICEPVTLVSTIGAGPLCASGTTFIGWSGIGIANCILDGLLTGLSSGGSGEYRTTSLVSLNPYDIYFPNTGSIYCETHDIVIPGVVAPVVGLGGAGYRYVPVLIDPQASIVPTACHLGGCSSYIRDPLLSSVSTYRGIDIVDMSQGRLFRQDASTPTVNIVDTGYFIGGADYEYGSPIPRCSCGHMGELPLTWSAPTYGCLPSGATGATLPEDVPYCLDVMHVGGGFFPSDTPKYNSTYGVLLMKQEDKPLPVQPKDTIVTVVSCSDATGYVGVGLNNPLAKLHVYSESIIDTTTDYSGSCVETSGSYVDVTGWIFYPQDFGFSSGSFPPCECAQPDPDRPGACLVDIPYSNPTIALPADILSISHKIYVRNNPLSGWCVTPLYSGGVTYYDEYLAWHPSGPDPLQDQYRGTTYISGTSCNVSCNSDTGVYYDSPGVEHMILSNTLGVSTLLCPCDSDPYNEDAACNTTGAYNRLAWQYGYSTSCIEMDLNHDQFIEHSMAMLLSGFGPGSPPGLMRYVFVYPDKNYVPIPPRCECDLNDYTADCNEGPTGGWTFSGSLGGPAACIDWVLHDTDLTVPGGFAGYEPNGYGDPGESDAYMWYQFVKNEYSIGTGACGSWVTGRDCTDLPATTSYAYTNVSDGPYVGMNGMICPCDTDPYNADPACSVTGTYVRPHSWTNGGGTQSWILGSYDCDDLDLNNQRLISHSMNTVSGPGPNDTITVYPSGIGPFDMPRCFCDINDFTEDCGGDGVASGWVASESDPDACYDWSLSSVVYPLPSVGRLAPANYPSARVFLFNGFNKYVTAVTPGSGQLCTGTLSFITGSSYTGTLIITATGTIPTFRVDNGPGIIYSPYIGAGLVGATTLPYSGANMYVIGRRVGINFETPIAALDLFGNALFRSLPVLGYDYLGIDNYGNLFATGNLGASASGDLWTPYTYLGTGLAYYSGNVGIGTSTPWATLHVSGDIMTDSTYIVSDWNLKENIAKVNNSLANLLSMTGYTFTWIASQKDDVGLLAQEIEQVYPEAVKTFSENGDGLAPVNNNANLNNNANNNNQATSIKSVEYQNLIGVVIAALRDMDAKMMNAGTARLAEQNLQIANLTARIALLEGGKGGGGCAPKDPNCNCPKNDPKCGGGGGGDLINPDLNQVIIQSSNPNDPLNATLGEMVQVTFRATEELDVNSVLLTIAGQQSGPISSFACEDQQGNPGGFCYYGVITVDQNTIAGPATFTLNYNDLAGNPGVEYSSTTDGSSVFISNQPQQQQPGGPT